MVRAFPRFTPQRIAWLPQRLVCLIVAFLLIVGCGHFRSSAFAADQTLQTSAKLASIFAGAAPQNIDELRAMQDHLQKLTEKVTPCTVGVQVGSAQGSGVIVSADGYVLTAAHVAGHPGRNVTLILSDGRRIQAITLGMNRGIDAGLIKITTEGTWPFVEMGSSSELKEGQWCMVTGHPGGYQVGRKPVVRVGRVLTNRDSVVVTDCALVGGDSGGPLFDMDGKVIGINSRIGNQLTANMHVPVKTYHETWDRLVNSEAWGSTGGDRPFIGVQGDTDAEEAIIAAVYPNTPAQKAGVQPGDVITHFDGYRVTDFANLRRMVGDKNPGDKVELQIQRGEETMTLKLVIGNLGG